MNKSNEKVCVTSSKLFLEVSSVVGKVEALEQLTKAYRKYPHSLHGWFWDDDILSAFTWDATEQGHNYWKAIYNYI